MRKYTKIHNIYFPEGGAKLENTENYLECERNRVYYTLIAIAGFLGAYTFLLRGKVFCNAQTGNLVLFGLAVGQGELEKAAYYLLPISAYTAGAFISELLPNPVKYHLKIRWDTLLIAVEMAVVLALGLVPDSAPVQISQVAVNFIASMQYNTFRQAEGTPMATTFATNHIRQVGVGLAKEIQHFWKKDKKHREKWGKHCMMVVYFLLGVVFGTVACNIYSGKAIWLTLLPFLIVLIDFLNEDLHAKEEEMKQKPHGH